MKQNCNIIRFEEVDSTNSRLYACRRFLQSGTVFAASFQSAGRGQKGNRWAAEKGENLTFSLLFKPKSIPAESQFRISAAASLAIIDYLKETGIDATIKWPNDIYVGDRKICGMLIENSVSGTLISSSVIGIGLNLNQRIFGKEIPNPTSVSILTGTERDLEREMERLLDKLPVRLGQAETDNGLLDEYNALLYRRGVECDWLDCRNSPETNLTASNRKVDAGKTITGKITGTNNQGLLQIKLKSGPEILFSFKEIRYLNLPCQQ